MAVAPARVTRAARSARALSRGRHLVDAAPREQRHGRRAPHGLRRRRRLPRTLARDPRRVLSPAASFATQTCEQRHRGEWNAADETFAARGDTASVEALRRTVV